MTKPASGQYRWRRGMVMPILVAMLSGAIFSGCPKVTDRLPSYTEEKFFADESADIAQTFYFRLFFLRRDLHHVDWLHYAAFDHMPVFKYMIGASLHLHGLETPQSLARFQEWIYFGNFDAYPPNVMKAARLPMLLGAVFGCVMIFVIGRQLNGTLTGLLAASLLTASPLYYIHARRAMADDLVYGFVMAAFACFLWLCRRALLRNLTSKSFCAIVLLGGFATALAPATKLNGGTAGLTIGVLAFLSLFAKTSLNKPRWKATIFGGALAMGVVSILVFIAINPVFYAQPKLPAEYPKNEILSIEGLGRSKEWLELMHQYANLNLWGRAKEIVHHRASVVVDGGSKFPHLSLPTVPARARAIVEDGMGKYSAFGLLPEGVQFNYRWIAPLCLSVIGVCIAMTRGMVQFRDGAPPIDWLLIIWPIAELAVLLPGMTVNFDRYHMGMVVWTSLICAYGFTGLLQSIGRRLVLAPPTAESERT